MQKICLGIDLGGSNIFSIAWDQKNNIVAQYKVATCAHEGYQSVLKRITASVLHIQKQISNHHQIVAIGLCVPGVVDKADSSIAIAPNLGWKNVNPLHDLKKRTPFKKLKSFVVLNDANAGLLGDLASYKEVPQNAVGIFCGTGVGGAIYIKGELYIGSQGGAGEIGHMLICANGKKNKKGLQGSLESYIGKWALNKRIQKAFDANIKTDLKKIVTYDLKKTPIKSSSLKKALQKKDSFTIELIHEYSKYLGIAMSQVANVLEPQVIILGGGMMEALGEKILPRAKKYLKKYCLVAHPSVRIIRDGDQVGPYGAAMLAKKRINN